MIMVLNKWYRAIGYFVLGTAFSFIISNVANASEEKSSRAQKDYSIIKNLSSVMIELGKDKELVNAINLAQKRKSIEPVKATQPEVINDISQPDGLDDIISNVPLDGSSQAQIVPVNPHLPHRDIVLDVNPVQYVGDLLQQRIDITTSGLQLMSYELALDPASMNQNASAPDLLNPNSPDSIDKHIVYNLADRVYSIPVFNDRLDTRENLLSYANSISNAVAFAMNYNDSIIQSIEFPEAHRAFEKAVISDLAASAGSVAYDVEGNSLLPKSVESAYANVAVQIEKQILGRYSGTEISLLDQAVLATDMISQGISGCRINTEGQQPVLDSTRLYILKVNSTHQEVKK